MYEINREEDGTPYITYTLPRSEASGLVNNKKEAYSFKYKKQAKTCFELSLRCRFNEIFEQSTKQDKIFEQVAQPVIDKLVHYPWGF